MKAAMPHNTLARLSEWLVRDYRLDPGQITPNATLQDLGIDSLGTVELLWSVEERFGIQLPHDPPALNTLGEVVAYVDALVAQQQASPTPAPAAAVTRDTRSP
jgi:acyl carrier protein